MQLLGAQAQRKYFGKIKTLVLEDQAEVLEHLSAVISDVPNCEVIKTRDYEEARDIVIKGNCSIFVTDLLIEKKRSNGRKSQEIATNILRKIQEDMLLVPTIVTSAYEDLWRDVQNENLATYVIEKGENCEDEIQEKAAELVAVLHFNRESLYDMLINLHNAITKQDLQTKVECYSAAKKLVTQLNFRENYIPVSHRKGIWSLRNTILYLSAVPSPKLGLIPLTHKALQLICELAQKCTQPRFNYSTEARIILDELSLMGYCHLPLIDIDQLEPS